MPEGTEVLQEVFIHSIETKLMGLLPAIMGKREECTSEELIAARKKTYGDIIALKLTPEQPVAELWDQTRGMYDELG
ncbi:hypothetical protein PM082_018142 [Marasmius tenuissimus]|nr:hypothetical protein PM082_018142 [Marasmius tenuissimus]